MVRGCKMYRLCLALAGLWLMSANAFAGTVTFDGYSVYGEPVVDGEFVYDTSTVYARPGVVYLHDDGGITRTSIRKSPRSTFTLKSVDVLTLNRILISGYKAAPEIYTEEHDAWARSRKYPADMFYLIGFRDRQPVARTVIGETGDWTTIHFGEEFRDIDALVARIAIPSTANFYAQTEALGPNQKWCEEWCADMFIDNMVIAAPVPASALTLGTGIVALFGFAGMRRRAA